MENSTNNIQKNQQNRPETKPDSMTSKSDYVMVANKAIKDAHNNQSGKIVSLSLGSQPTRTGESKISKVSVFVQDNQICPSKLDKNESGIWFNLDEYYPIQDGENKKILLKNGLDIVSECKRAQKIKAAIQAFDVVAQYKNLFDKKDAGYPEDDGLPHRHL